MRDDHIPLDTITTLKMLDENPAAVYQRLRREMPVVRVKAINRIVLTKADDAYLAKTDTRHFHSSDDQTPMQRAFGGHTLMRKDGAKHRCERAAMTETFHERHMSCTWQTVFKDIADKAISALPGDGPVDLRAALAAPFSASFVQKLLGIETKNTEQLFGWATALVTGAMNASFDPAIFAKSDVANDEMNACFDLMSRHHEENPNPSVLSVMVNAKDKLPLSQMRTNMKICIGGAVIESRDAISTILHGLLQNPDQLAFCRETERWDLAVDEGLRWCAPIQASPRIVAKEITLRGVTLPRGETIMVVQGSANHDEDYWQDPHLFNIHRPPVANQTFGLGTHRCLGGDMFRRLVSKILLPRLFNRFPDLTAARETEVRFKGFAFRGPTCLPVYMNGVR